MVKRDTPHPPEAVDELKSMAKGPARRPLRCRVKRTAKAPTETHPTPADGDDWAQLARTLTRHD